MAPAFPLPGEPVVPVRGDGDDGGVPRHSLWRKTGTPPGRGQHRGFEPRHVGEGWGWEAGLEEQGEPSEPNVLNRIARAERLEPASLNWPTRTCSPAPDPSEPVSAHPALLYPCPRTWPFRTCVPELAHPGRLAGSAGRIWGAGVRPDCGDCPVFVHLGPGRSAPSGFRCCAGDSECCFAVRVAGILAILYICSKVVCFLVTRLVVRPGRWVRLAGTRRRRP